MSAEKQTIREQAKRVRAMIDLSDPQEHPQKAADYFFESFDITSDTIIAGYMPKAGEFDLFPLIDTALANNHKLAMPIIQKDTRILDFVLWDNQTQMEKGPYDIFQPKLSDSLQSVVPDIVIVPLLAFDLNGNRIGYGGGYYDATLQALRAQNDKLIAVGLCYARQAVIFKLPTEDHDQKLDWVITPQMAKNYN
jgi:5-formyltetrahydrofolate cyclo-ligase